MDDGHGIATFPRTANEPEYPEPEHVGTVVEAVKHPLFGEVTHDPGDRRQGETGFLAHTGRCCGDVCLGDALQDRNNPLKRPQGSSSTPAATAMGRLLPGVTRRHRRPHSIPVRERMFHTVKWPYKAFPASPGSAIVAGMGRTSTIWNGLNPNKP